MACDCLNKVNATLRDKGYTMNCTLFGEPEKPLFSLIRLDTWKPETRKGKPSSMMPDFCPWCGERYEPFKSLVHSEEWAIEEGANAGS